VQVTAYQKRFVFFPFTTLGLTPEVELSRIPEGASFPFYADSQAFVPRSDPRAAVKEWDLWSLFPLIALFLPSSSDQAGFFLRDLRYVHHAFASLSRPGRRIRNRTRPSFRKFPFLPPDLVSPQMLDPLPFLPVVEWVAQYPQNSHFHFFQRSGANVVPRDPFASLFAITLFHSPEEIWR